MPGLGAARSGGHLSVSAVQPNGMTIFFAPSGNCILITMSSPSGFLKLQDFFPFIEKLPVLPSFLSPQ